MTGVVAMPAVSWVSLPGHGERIGARGTPAVPWVSLPGHGAGSRLRATPAVPWVSLPGHGAGSECAGGGRPAPRQPARTSASLFRNDPLSARAGVPGRETHGTASPATSAAMQSGVSGRETHGTASPAHSAAVRTATGMGMAAGVGSVLFAGGGTGGHVFPALAVAEELAGRGWTVAFAGTAGGFEEGLVAGRGWPFAALPARPLVGRNPLAQVRALATVGRSTLAARGLIRRRGVDAVVGTGGYVSAPAVLGARLAGRPALIVEPNADPGVANRWLSRWAAGAAVAYAATGARLHCPSWVTGVPVRREFFALAPRAAAGGATGGPHLLVLGGSQGARQLNRDLPLALARVARELPGLTVVHQAGRGHEEATREAYAAAGFVAGAPGGSAATGTAGAPGGASPVGARVEVTGFIDGVAAAMAAADLVVSRAGAITAAELCAAGRAALLVPLALAGGHQAGNALLLAAAGAAVVAPADAGPGRLAEILGALLADPGRRAAMGRAARALAREGAAAAIADRVEALAGRRPDAPRRGAAGGAEAGGAGAGHGTAGGEEARS